ncbi:MAG TPA: hypothetical protein VEJ68_04060 [Candidatus Bathyarchaeia archaeon]|nr:hypothetical protein [Candidatus Bathyarchaeia archaeon]
MDKPSVDEMWAFIEKILLPYDDVPDRTRMNEDKIFELYSMIKDADELFRMLAKIATLKKAIEDRRI